MLKTVLIDYGGGNIASAYNALQQVAPNNMVISIGERAKDIQQADYLVLPGQGAFAGCMKNLRSREQWISSLNDKVLQGATPFLGICVGMQIMMQKGNENGVCRGLGWLDGEITKLKAGVQVNDTMMDKQVQIKIPQMGWNEIYYCKQHPVWGDVAEGSNMYFVHSYGQIEMNQDVLAFCEYGGKIAAIMGRDNMIGFQFHAEKSHNSGIQLINNFLQWKP